jgi:hypothetical protein
MPVTTKRASRRAPCAFAAALLLRDRAIWLASKVLPPRPGQERVAFDPVEYSIVHLIFGSEGSHRNSSHLPYARRSDRNMIDEACL